jgi:ribosomal protein S6--L-glutamate ligase
MLEQRSVYPHHQRHIGLLAERRYLTQAQPAGLCAVLCRRGYRVARIDLEATTHAVDDLRWLDGLDLVVARGRSCALLCLLAAAEARRRPTLNRRTAIATVHNKVEMAVTLAAGHIPTPPTFFGPPAYLAAQIPAARYPLILKPIFGDNAEGLRIIATPEEMAALAARNGTRLHPEPVALAQSYLPNDGYDLKLYGIGDEIWAVRKPSPLNQDGAHNGAKAAEPVPLTPALQALGRRCGELFGLELFGVDCLQTTNGIVVIEVNDFPNYTGVPDGDERLAAYVIRRAREGNLE